MAKNGFGRTPFFGRLYFLFYFFAGNFSADQILSNNIDKNKNKITEFKNRLSNNSDIIHQMTNDVNSEPIDIVVQNVTRILHDNAFEVFGKTFDSSSYTTHKKESTQRLV